MKIRLLLFICFTISVQYVAAQDISSAVKNFKERLKKDPIKTSGSIGLGSNLYKASGIENRKANLGWNVNASLNFDILGIKAPFSLAFSNGNTQFQLPSYSVVGISPSYKWATVHVGMRSITFSKYSLSGHSFNGVGVELKPKKFRFSAMYGTLKRAQLEDLQSKGNIESVYKRIGMGVKMGYEGTKHTVLFNVFSAKDDENSIPLPVNSITSPQENLVFGFEVKHKLGKNLSLNYDFSKTYLNQNGLINASTKRKMAAGLFMANSSFLTANAYKASLNSTVLATSIGIQFERVDPGYKTLGVLSFQNDFENYTVNLSRSFIKGKLNISTSGGLQRNNLDNLASNDALRVLSSAIISATITPKWQLGLSLSNFQNTNKIKTPTSDGILIDSLILLQSNRNASLNSSWTIGSETPQTIAVMASYVEGNSIQNDSILLSSVSKMYQSSCVYSLQLPDLKMSVSLSGNYNRADLQMQSTETFAPALNISKPIFNEKVQTSLSFAYTFVKVNKVENSRVFNSNMSLSWSFLEKHNMSFNFSFMARPVVASQQNSGNASFTEINAGMQYGYSF